IRDRTVTGVQTCALPISWSDNLTGIFATYGILAALQARERTGRGQRVDTNQIQATMSFMNEPYSSLFAAGIAPDPFKRPAASQRSEERRVGKEGKSRGVA